MTSKVLVADDSLTIQKVIGITLASSGYELVECLNESELFRKIQSNHYDLILLDFNLSDSRSGYELSKQISHVLPQAAIIVMLGTFDTIDESQFESCGITDKIVKPFESSKFIKKCRDLLESGPREIKKSSKPDEVKDQMLEDNYESNLDSWKVDSAHAQTKVQDESVRTDDVAVSHGDFSLDPLESEIEGWGFTTGQSLEEKYQKVFPPVIEESSEEVNILDRLASSSQFIKDEDVVEDTSKKFDETDPSFVIPEDLNRNLLNEIEEDISAEAFWAVDEIVPIKSEEQADIRATHLQEVTADLTDKVKEFKSISMELNPVEVKPIETPVLNQDEIVEKLKLSLRPMIEEMVKQFCRESAEKVAWEVIPDLAENLIRKEIKEISESLQH